MTDPQFDNVLKDDENQPVNFSDEGQKSGSFDPSVTGTARPDDLTDEELVDRGNHENEVVKNPPHINDAGELVDDDGKKVFTTVEETIKDGSMVLDEKGRQPGVYLDDIEEEERQRMRERYEEAYNKANHKVNSIVERQVNVNMSPIPPVTVTTHQEAPVADKDEEVSTTTE